MSNQEQQGSLSEKFQGFGAAPSDALWDSIAAAVDEKKSRRGLFWWWLGSGLAASFVLVYLSVNFFGTEENLADIPLNENYTSDYRAKTEHKKILNHSLHKNSNDKAISGDQLYSNHPKINNELNKENSINLIDPLNNGLISSDKLAEAKNLIEPEKQIKVLENKNKNKNKNLNLDLNEDLMKLGKSEIDLLSTERAHPQMLNLDLSKKMRHNPWEIGFNLAYYADVNLGFMSKKQEVYPLSSNDFSESAFISGTQPETINTTQGLLPPTSNVVPSTQSSVSRNINVDFYAAKYLSKRWMFSTGLGFTRSTYKTIYNNGFLMTQITNISSMIVPIGISLDVVKLPKFKLRTDLTLNNEFAFYEKLETEALSPYYGPKGFIKGYSASLQFSLGHVFQIRPRVALNVAPSFRYYLSQNIQSQNYLIKRNQWIGGKIGMIWTL